MSRLVQRKALLAWLQLPSLAAGEQSGDHEQSEEEDEKGESEEGEAGDGGDVPAGAEAESDEGCGDEGKDCLKKIKLRAALKVCSGEMRQLR